MVNIVTVAACVGILVAVYTGTIAKVPKDREYVSVEEGRCMYKVKMSVSRDGIVETLKPCSWKPDGRFAQYDHITGEKL